MNYEVTHVLVVSFLNIFKSDGIFFSKDYCGKGYFLTAPRLT